MQIWFQICRAYDLVAGVASFETHAKPHHRRTLRQLHAGKLERDMTDAEIRAADAWIKDHFLWMAHPEQRPTLEWFLDKAEVAVVRHGARIIQLDPVEPAGGVARQGRERDRLHRSLPAHAARLRA